MIRAWRGSYALRLLSNRTAAGNPELHDFLSRMGLVEPFVEQVPPPEMWPYGLGHRAEVTEMWRRVEAVIGALDDEVGRRRERLVLFYVPAGFEQNDRAWELTRRRYHMGRRWQRDRVFEGLADLAVIKGLSLADPRPSFREVEALGQRTYFPEDGHWNELGNRLAARALYGAVVPLGGGDR